MKENSSPEPTPSGTGTIPAADMAEEPSVVTPKSLENVSEEDPDKTTSSDLGEVPPLSHVIEAILFASQKPVTTKEISAYLKGAAATEPNSAATSFARIKEDVISEALAELQAEVAALGRSYEVRETATGWILSSTRRFAPWLRALYPEAKPTRLSASALETLAIVAYRQPVTRADMEAVRGVSVDGVVQTLLDRGLVKIAGRAEVAGRPLLYATTQYFLDHFGLRHLDELPNAVELRHLPLPKATPDSSSAEISDEERVERSKKLENSMEPDLGLDKPADSQTSEETPDPNSIRSEA